MSLGESRATIVPGGGAQLPSAAQIARAVVQIGVSPLGTVNVLKKIGGLSAIPTQLDTGPLAEAQSIRARTGQTGYCMPVNPSVAGKASAVVQTGNIGAGTVAVTIAPHKQITIKCITGGTLGTATFQFSLDGGTTYGDIVTSTSSSYVVRVPGTFCTLTFAAATYVATKLCTVGVDGVVTNGTLWVGAVTQVSSPIDSYEVVLTVKSGTALGAMTLGVSLDAGRGSRPNQIVPASGVVILSGTGLVCTLAGTFGVTDSYAFSALPPGFSTSDITAAMTALRADRTLKASLVQVVGLPSSAAGAASLSATLQTALDAAFNNDGIDWCGACDSPVLNDIVMPSSTVVADSADTDVVLTAARGANTDRVAMHYGTYPMVSPLTGDRLRRPLSWFAVKRYVDTDPRDDLSAVALGDLGVFVPAGSATTGRDEDVTPSLDDIQGNTARTYRNRNGMFLSITAGGFGWKNQTTQSNYQDAGAMRILNACIAKLRILGQELLGQRPQTNADGTIEEMAARRIEAKLDKALKRACGLAKGGDYILPQASFASCQVLRTSQLGDSPHRIDLQYQIQGLGFISDVNGIFQFSGVLSITG